MRHPTFLLAVLMFAALPHTAAQQPYKSITDFGVRVERGQPVYPLPSNVALGLFNLEDPLLDVAYYAEGKVQVFQNLGNGLLTAQPVYERRVSGAVVLAGLFAFTRLPIELAPIPSHWPGCIENHVASQFFFVSGS